MARVKNQNLRVRGPLPNPGEVSVYFLRNNEGKVFYAGVTKNPMTRASEHCRNHGEVTMCILRNVPEERAGIEEAIAISELTAAGINLANQAVGINQRTLPRPQYMGKMACLREGIAW